MDYRVLLKKYIDYVARQADDFLYLDGSTPEEGFTAEEWAELKQISRHE